MKQQAIYLIKNCLQQANRPAVLWSGGKDSGVLLYIALQIKPDIEIIHWKIPFLPAKYSFHETVRAALNLTVHDWIPQSVALCHGNDRVDFMETYGVASTAITVARGTERPEQGKPFVCGRDWLRRPTGIVNAPFDLLLCGHKTVDEDPLSGPIPLQLDVLELPGTKIAYPLKEWTDQDIWNFHTENNIPYDLNRYEVKETGQIGNKADKHLNSDYFHTCVACIDKRESEFVYCPKINCTVNNVSANVPEYAPSHSYCKLRK